VHARPLSHAMVVVILASIVGCGGAGPSRTYEPPERSGDRAEAPGFTIGGGQPQASTPTTEPEEAWAGEVPFLAQTYDGEVGDVSMDGEATTTGGFYADTAFSFTSARVSAQNPDGSTQMAIFSLTGRLADLAHAPSGVYSVRRDGSESSTVPPNSQVDLDGSEAIIELDNSDFVNVITCAGPDPFTIDVDVNAGDVTLEFEEPVVDDETGDFTRRVTFDLTAYDGTAIVGRATGTYTVGGQGEVAPSEEAEDDSEK